MLFETAYRPYTTGKGRLRRAGGILDGRHPSSRVLFRADGHGGPSVAFALRLAAVDADAGSAFRIRQQRLDQMGRYEDVVHEGEPLRIASYPARERPDVLVPGQLSPFRQHNVEPATLGVDGHLEGDGL